MKSAEAPITCATGAMAHELGETVFIVESMRNQTGFWYSLCVKLAP